MLKVHFTQLYIELFLPCFRIAQNNWLLYSLILKSKMQTSCFVHLFSPGRFGDLKPPLHRLCARRCLSFLLARVKLTHTVLRFLVRLLPLFSSGKREQQNRSIENLRCSKKFRDARFCVDNFRLRDLDFVCSVYVYQKLKER
ncbi:hypothetical protein POPTR_002G146750v4 [Populus trichocarpa]|uniref:Uncharacterized protein n=1 Tax=Populus trichocarpa TaxID=3694 RepID=A0A3N7FJ50_POPTR|nr:hypothetical protein POPTR_002G146750v4 [Populus trichocarpa]